MRFVVTGSPRSATRFASVFFDRLGVPCTHEKLFKVKGSPLDVVRWYRDTESGESSWLAWVFLRLIPGPVTVFHSRRNPWTVIDSLAHRNRIVNFNAEKSELIKSLRDVMNAYCPRVAEHTEPIDRAAALLIDWNQSIEDAVNSCPNVEHYHSYRVEELDEAHVRYMLNIIGVERTNEQIDAALHPELKQTNRGLITTRHDDISMMSNQDVVRFIEENWGAKITSFQRIGPTDEKMTAVELAGRMDPALVSQVNDYAARFDYETVPELISHR